MVICNRLRSVQGLPHIAHSVCYIADVLQTGLGLQRVDASP
jgi:hypothetical protein